jgi:hypothetical protein
VARASAVGNAFGLTPRGFIGPILSDLAQLRNRIPPFLSLLDIAADDLLVMLVSLCSSFASGRRDSRNPQNVEVAASCKYGNHT